MKKHDQYDIVVIGSGPAGMTVADQCVAAGRKVAVVDKEFGGTCALKGCTPKKVMAASAEILRHACNLNGHGIRLDNMHLHWDDLLKFKRSFTEMVPAHTIEALQEKGIAVVEGAARFTAPNVISVDGRQIRADHFAICTGAEPVPLPFEGSDYLITSEQLLEFDGLPEHVVFIGGGYVSFELAQIVNKCGRQVTILEGADKPLAHFDKMPRDVIMEAFQNMGVDIRTGIRISTVSKEKKGFKITYSDAQGDKILTADLVVHGAGRRAAVEALDLKVAEVEVSDHGIVTNEFLQSATNSRVYAAGDVSDTGHPFTLVADYEGRIVAHNMTSKRRRSRREYTTVPAVLFTSPKVGMIGATESELAASNIEYTVKEGRIGHWLISASLKESYSAYKVLLSNADHILGAHLVGPKADEVINAFAIAMQHDITARELKATFMSYPTAFAEIRKMI